MLRLRYGVLLVATSLCVSARGGVSTVSIPTVPVGSPGNAADSSGFGSVGYAYSIGEYDVTASQYCAFLNAVAASDPYGIYHPNMAGTTLGNPGIIQSGSSGSFTYSVIDGRGNYPVTDVSFWNATRFANWLDNGQPNAPEGAGTTETGTYNLFTTAMDAALLATPTNKNYLTTTQADNNAVTRSANAQWAVSSENEWYKAAYYDPALNGGAGGYFQFPVASNSMNDTQANIGGAGINDTTPVGSYADPSYYGTYDQGGDVYQWNETETDGFNVRGMRGGAWDDGGDYGRAGSYESTYQQPWIADNDLGFRVSLVPEPASIGVIGMVAATLLMRRKR
jgi:formylglycine-generating enzyme required for sulfatase activity